MTESIIQRKEKELADLKRSIQECEDVAKIKEMSARADGLILDIAELKESAKRSVTQLEPKATYGQEMRTTGKDISEVRSSMEYRTAFMDYVQNGRMTDILRNADAEGVSGDLGVLLPNTVIQEIITGVEKVYGQLYSRVKKTNVKGGVQYPIGEFFATMSWDGTSGDDKQHGVSAEQGFGKITDSVTFTYHIGEVRIARSLLQSILSVPVFEAELVKTIVESYVKAMDTIIMKGDGSCQGKGILTVADEGNSRITADHIITMSASDMADWKQVQKKIFAKIPLSMRAEGFEFFMTAGTWEANIKTLADDNNRPVASETYDMSNGGDVMKFRGRNVVLLESDMLYDFEDANAGGKYVMMIANLGKGYAINTNMQFGYKTYFDEATNKYITKALVVADGNVLDPKYIYLVKKASS